MQIIKTWQTETPPMIFGAEPKMRIINQELEFLLVLGDALKGIHNDGWITTILSNHRSPRPYVCQESGLPLSYDPEILREYFDKLPGLQFQRFLGVSSSGGEFS